MKIHFPTYTFTSCHVCVYNVDLLSVVTQTHVRCLQVPVLLVRGDGIIYATGLTFTYTPEPGASSTSSRLSDSIMWHTPETGLVSSVSRHSDSVPWHANPPAGRVSPRTLGFLQPPPAHTANGGYSGLTASDRFINVS